MSPLEAHAWRRSRLWVAVGRWGKKVNIPEEKLCQKERDSCPAMVHIATEREWDSGGNGGRRTCKGVRIWVAPQRHYSFIKLNTITSHKNWITSLVKVANAFKYTFLLIYAYLIRFAYTYQFTQKLRPSFIAYESPSLNKLCKYCLACEILMKMSLVLNIQQSVFFFINQRETATPDIILFSLPFGLFSESAYRIHPWCTLSGNLSITIWSLQKLLFKYQMTFARCWDWALDNVLWGG